jgi:hypothetical protein
MPVTLTDEQAKNSAASLRVSAAVQTAVADQLDPTSRSDAHSAGRRWFYSSSFRLHGSNAWRPGSVETAGLIRGELPDTRVSWPVPQHLQDVGRLPDELPDDGQVRLLRPGQHRCGRC